MHNIKSAKHVHMTGIPLPPVERADTSRSSHRSPVGRSRPPEPFPPSRWLAASSASSCDQSLQDARETIDCMVDLSKYLYFKKIQTKVKIKHEQNIYTHHIDESFNIK